MIQSKNGLTENERVSGNVSRQQNKPDRQHNNRATIIFNTKLIKHNFVRKWPIMKNSFRPNISG